MSNRLSEIKSRLSEITSELVVQGWSYDNARFAVMSADAGDDGIMSEQAAAESNALLSEAETLVSELKSLRTLPKTLNYAKQAYRNEMHEQHQQ